MKRIAGIFHLDGRPVDPVRIRSMLAEMHVQTGSDEKFWIKGNIGLGSFKYGGDLEEDINDAGKTDFSRSQVIVFNGRIDNRKDLIARLIPEPNCPDEKLVLKAFEVWGQDFLSHLIGDFAFALWDEPNRTLLCARDHFGNRPLYYYQDHQAFVFASTPQALFRSGCCAAKINEGRIADFLFDYLEGIDKTSSFYDGINKLPPAHWLEVSQQGLKLSRYWRITPIIHLPDTKEQDYLEQFQVLLEEAVRCRLANTLTPASMLSGGIDSCSVVAMGRKILEETPEREFHTFSLISENPILHNRETANIQAVLQQGNLQPNLITESRLNAQLERIIQSIENEDDPFDHLNNLRRSISLGAQAGNIHSMMDGVDGDLLLVSSDYVADLWREGKIGLAIGETLALNGIDVSLKYRLSRLIQSLRSAFVPDWLRSLRRKFRYFNSVGSALKDTLINREFAARIKIDDRLQTFEAQRDLPVTASQVERNINAFEHAFIPVGLERSERISSEFSIEASHPLLDIRLVEFCVGLPWQQKFNRGRTKLILRRAVEPLLPAQVVWRKDKDSLLWFFNKLVLKARADYFYQSTLEAMDLLKAYIDPPKLLDCWKSYRNDGDDNSAGYVWTGYALARWLLKQNNGI